jgi:hypothetical protein
MGHASMEGKHNMAQFVNTPFLSRKVIASTVTGALTFVAAWAVTHFALNLSPDVVVSVTGLATAAGTFIGGFVKRELPNVTTD